MAESLRLGASTVGIVLRRLSLTQEANHLAVAQSTRLGVSMVPI